MSHELIPALLVRFGPFFALEDLCEKNSNPTLQFQFECNINNSQRYTEDFEIKVYFIISELINNIIKHSKATTAKIIIKDLG